MKVIIYSKKTMFTNFMQCLLSKQKISVLRASTEEEINEILHKQNDVLAVLLDFPSPKLEDFALWRNLVTITQLPIWIINSNVSNIEYAQLRGLATLQLSEPLIDFFSVLNPNLCVGDLNLKDDEIKISSNITFKVGEHSIEKNGEDILLSTSEFKLLFLLSTKRGKSFKAEELINHLRLTGHNTLYVYIKKLREKLEENPCKPKLLIHSREKGYYLNCG